jgi:hypothetical protein
MSLRAIQWAWKQQIKSGEKLVLLALANYANTEDKAWPGQKAIAYDCGMNRDTVVTHLAALVRYGLITSEDRRTERGHKQSARHRLQLEVVIGQHNVGKTDIGNQKPYNEKPDIGHQEPYVEKTNVGISDIGKDDDNNHADNSNANVGKSYIGKTDVGISDTGDEIESNQQSIPMSENPTKEKPMSEFSEAYVGIFGKNDDALLLYKDRTVNGTVKDNPPTPQGGDVRKTSKTKNAYPEIFESLWKRYPTRAGGNSKEKAYRAFNARLNEGYTSEEMSDGLDRYVRYAASKNWINTEYVMKAQRFFGAGKEFQDAWMIPVNNPTPHTGGHNGTRKHTVADDNALEAALMRNLEQQRLNETQSSRSSQAEQW